MKILRIKHLIVAGMLGCFALTQPLFAQNAKKTDKREKIAELRKKYFNEKLALSETEQKNFWPLYDEYREKEKALRDSFHRRYKRNEVVFMDDKQAEEYLQATLKLNEDQHTLYREYVLRFKKVIPVKKVAMLQMVERDFKREILRHARPHRSKGKASSGPGQTR